MTIVDIRMLASAHIYLEYVVNSCLLDKRSILSAQPIRVPSPYAGLNAGASTRSDAKAPVVSRVNLRFLLRFTCTRSHLTGVSFDHAAKLAAHYRAMILLMYER